MRRFSQLAIPYAVWVALMILLPMLLILLYAFTTQGNDIVNFSFTLDHFIRFFTDQDFLLILWRSLVIAFKTTIICVLYAWIGILSDGGILQNILSFLGFGEPELLYTEGAVLLGMVYNFLPFMILQVNTSLCKMDKSLLEASADLGANRFQTFRRVTFPLSLSGVISGITLVFLPAVSSFFIPKLLGGGQFFLIGNVIENQFITVGEWNFGSAISMIMAVVMMLCMFLIRRVDERNSGRGRRRRRA